MMDKCTCLGADNSRVIAQLGDKLRQPDCSQTCVRTTQPPCHFLPPNACYVSRVHWLPHRLAAAAAAAVLFAAFSTPATCPLSNPMGAACKPQHPPRSSTHLALRTIGLVEVLAEPHHHHVEHRQRFEQLPGIPTPSPPPHGHGRRELPGRAASQCARHGQRCTPQCRGGVRGVAAGRCVNGIKDGVLHHPNCGKGDRRTDGVRTLQAPLEEHGAV